MTGDDHFGRPAMLSVLDLAKPQSLSEGAGNRGQGPAPIPRLGRRGVGRGLIWLGGVPPNYGRVCPCGSATWTRDRFAVGRLRPSIRTIRSQVGRAPLRSRKLRTMPGGWAWIGPSGPPASLP